MPCYYPSEQERDDLVPCNTTAEVSHCCRTTDICLSNGYCFSTETNTIVRQGCTDVNFSSTACPQACLSGSGYEPADVPLTSCDAYTFCCGQDKAARDCCDSGDGPFRIPGGPVMLRKELCGDVSVISGILTSTTISSIATVTATGSGDFSGVKDSSTCPSVRRTTIGVGAGLGATLLVMATAAGFFAYKWQSTKKRLDWNLGLFESQIQMERRQITEMQRPADP